MFVTTKKKYSLINCKNGNFLNLIQKYSYDFHQNDIIAGKIISLETTGMLVDIGSLGTSFLPFQEVNYNKKNINTDLIINQIREFLILNQFIKRNLIIISAYRLDCLRSWKRIKVMSQEDIIINTEVIGLNKGGFLTSVESLIGFIPNSHLPSIKNNVPNIKELKVKVLEINKQDNILNLSNKCALISQNIDQLHVGNILEGIIEEIKPYGIYISINNLTALLHQAEIPKIYKKNLYEIFKLGNRLIVKILHVDIKYGRIFVTLNNENKTNN
jgi:small subunit ribosomal protein S1